MLTLFRPSRPRPPVHRPRAPRVPPAGARRGGPPARALGAAGEREEAGGGLVESALHQGPGAWPAASAASEPPEPPGARGCWEQAADGAEEVQLPLPARARLLPPPPPPGRLRPSWTAARTGPPWSRGSRSASSGWATRAGRTASCAPRVGGGGGQGRQGRDGCGDNTAWTLLASTWSQPLPLNLLASSIWPVNSALPPPPPAPTSCPHLPRPHRARLRRAQPPQARVHGGLDARRRTRRAAGTGWGGGRWSWGHGCGLGLSKLPGRSLSGAGEGATRRPAALRCIPEPTPSTRPSAPAALARARTAAWARASRRRAPTAGSASTPTTSRRASRAR
jgi:hypothetical protein